MAKFLFGTFCGWAEETVTQTRPHRFSNSFLTHLWSLKKQYFATSKIKLELNVCFVALFEFILQDLFAKKDAKIDTDIVFISAYSVSAAQDCLI